MKRRKILKNLRLNSRKKRQLLHVNAFRVNAKNIDPTKTTTLRTRFANDVSGRFAKVKKSVNEYISEINENRFEFETDVMKLEQFNEWLQEQINSDILSVNDEIYWTNDYIDSAYKSGTKHANKLLNDGGVETLSIDGALALPINKNSLELLYTRTYEGLKGITADMSTQMSRILAQGFADGKNPNDIAREMSLKIDNITRTRAKTLARTEVINTHANATLNNFEAAGVQNVKVIPEWLAAADACPICRALAEKEYTLKEARGMIPAHPNCRCAWAPKIVEE